MTLKELIDKLVVAHDLVHSKKLEVIFATDVERTRVYLKRVVDILISTEKNTITIMIL